MVIMAGLSTLGRARRNNGESGRGPGVHGDLQLWSDRARGRRRPVGSEKSPGPDAGTDAPATASSALPGWDENCRRAGHRLAVVTDVINADNCGRTVSTARASAWPSSTPVLRRSLVSTATGKLINGADLSFDSQSDPTRYLDAYGHGTHMASIIAGNDGRGVASAASRRERTSST